MRKGGLPLHEIHAYLGRVAITDRPDVAVSIDLIGHGPVGCGGFRNFDGDKGELSLILGEPSTWGRGLGTEALGLLLTFAFEQLALTMVWLVVRADNERAVALFRRHGFVIVERYVGAIVADNLPRDKYRMELQSGSWCRHQRIDNA